MLPMLITRAGSSRVAAASSSGKNARVRKNGVFRFRSTTLSQAAAGNSASGAPQVAPALLTSTFRACSRSATSLASRRHSASVDRSAGMAVTGPYWLSSASAAAQPSALRELMYTRAPASSRPRAIMSPIPRVPPVTTAVFPDRSNKSMTAKTTGAVASGSCALKWLAFEPPGRDGTAAHREGKVSGRAAQHRARAMRPAEVAGLKTTTIDNDVEVGVAATLSEVIEDNPDGLVRRAARHAQWHGHV